MGAFHDTPTPYTEIRTMTHQAPLASNVGVDLHQHSVTLDAKDPSGQVINRLTTSTKTVEKIDAWIEALPKPVWLVVEACPFCEWFIDRYRDKVARIGIADATALAAGRGKRRKNDRNDAGEVSTRMVRGDIPLGWIADEPIAELRKLGRHWRRLSRLISRAKHGIRSILHAGNHAGPGALNGASAQRWLLAHGSSLKAVHFDAYSDLMDLIQLLELQRHKLRRRIIAANGHERIQPMSLLLKSVPGIDEIWACILAAEVGDFGRFPNADTLEFWAGLTADNQESAGVSRAGHITKAGSATLRWALCKAAVTLCRCDETWEKRRQELIATRGKPIANVAMGRRLLHVLYAMFRDGAEFVTEKSRKEKTKTPSGGKTGRQSREVAYA
jgi:transposase